MRTFVIALFLGIVALCAGCTTVGPVVTNVAPDGKGNLVVEKSNIELNTFTGNMSFIGTTTSKIRMNNGQQSQ